MVEFDRKLRASCHVSVTHAIKPMLIWLPLGNNGFYMGLECYQIAVCFLYILHFIFNYGIWVGKFSCFWCVAYLNFLICHMDVFPLSVSISSLQPSYRSQCQRVENDKLQVNSYAMTLIHSKKKKKHAFNTTWLYSDTSLVILNSSHGVAHD